MNKIYTLVSATIFASSCTTAFDNNPTDQNNQQNQPPLAIIKADTLAGTAPLTVNLDGTSSFDDTGIVLYSWTVNGEFVSDLSELDYKFDTSGEYTITLTVTDTNGVTDIQTSTINVSAGQGSTNLAPTANAGQNQVVFVNQPVMLNGSLSNDDKQVTSFLWMIGSESFNGSTLEYTFTEAGEYPVELTVKDLEGESDTVAISVKVEPRTQPIVYAGDDFTIEQNQQAQFSATASDPYDGVLTYQWTIEGENFDQLTAVYTFATAGIYDVEFSASNPVSGTTTDVVQVTVTQSVNENQEPSAIFSASVLSGIAPLTVDFDAMLSSDQDGQIDQYLWSINGVSDNTMEQFSHEFTMAGTYTIELIVVDNEGKSSDAFEKIINVTDPIANTLPVLKAINSGSNTSVIYDSITFEADQYSTGGTVNSTTDDIAGAQEFAMLQTERYGSYRYEIPVSNDQYQVELFFVEMYQEDSNLRSFNVNVENTSVVSQIDLYNTVGHDTMYSLSSNVVSVNDNSLTIELESIIDNATISGFVIYSQNGEVLVIEPPIPEFDGNGLSALVPFPLGIAVPDGTGTSGVDILTNTPRQNIVKSDFTQITAENIMKMSYLENSFANADALVNWALDNDLTVHGHALVWHPDYQLPSWATNPGNNFKQQYLNQITNTATHFAGKVYSWDVVNEALYDGADSGGGDNGTGYRNSVFYEQYGNQSYIGEAFRAAKAADGNAILYYNDFNTEQNGSKTTALVGLISELVNQGVPIDGVGFQMHVINGFPSIANIRTSMQKIVDLDDDLLIKITEMDVRINNPYDNNTSNDFNGRNDCLNSCTGLETQKQTYIDIIQAYYDVVPEARRGGITIWGIADVDSWYYENNGDANLPDWPLLYNDNLQKKPAFFGVEEVLILNNPGASNTNTNANANINTVSTRSCDAGYIALTFDDGPTGNTSTLVDLINQHDLAPVTWFIQGQYLANNQNMAPTLLSVGVMQNHSYTHPHLTDLSYNDILSELTRTSDIIQNVGAPRPTIFRPPYGEANDNVRSAATSLGMITMNWDADSADWDGASSAQIAEVINQMQNGDSILMHDNGGWNTNAALAQISANMEAKGLCPGVLSPSTGRAVAP
ncbi:endo-1,4-beta-xylanase [Marinicellulosiphila megalodicopiae]|uniref:endo-1,4-beta-xylanase n=1 Tax=Marinicellulosiphila megalodicopiae TaxID=2724896 RepID=UPI003BB082D8